MQPAGSTPSSLGARLKGLREARGLNVAEVAEKLHIIPRYVRAIEAEQFSQLPGVVFLKGYVRAYARLLGLPEDRTVEELESLLAAKGDYTASADRYSEPLQGARASNRALVGGSGVLVLLVLVMTVWWLWPAAENSGDGNEPSVVAPSPGPVASGEGVPKAEPPREPLGGEVAEAPIVIPASGALELPLEVNYRADAVTSPLEPQAPAVTPSAVTVVESAPERSTADEAVPDVADAAQTAVAEEPMAPAGTWRIEAVFSGDCWLDIRDRDNQRTVQLFRTGQRMTFEGPPPMRVIVGAVDAVSLRVEGQPIDLRQYPVRNNRVEFILEP